MHGCWIRVQHAVRRVQCAGPPARRALPVSQVRALALPPTTRAATTAASRRLGFDGSSWPASSAAGRLVSGAVPAKMTEPNFLLNRRPAGPSVPSLPAAAAPLLGEEPGLAAGTAGSVAGSAVAAVGAAAAPLGGASRH
eukprot:5468470-Prymnesium_polylepis.1